MFQFCFLFCLFVVVVVVVDTFLNELRLKMLGVKNKIRRKPVVMMAICGDLRDGTTVTLWTVVAPCGRWSRLADGGRTLWTVVAPCGPWSHLTLR